MIGAAQAAEMGAAVSAYMGELRELDCKGHVVQFSIDGLVYTSEKLPARAGLDIGPRVTALLGTGILRLIVGTDDEGIGADQIAAALVSISDRAMRDGLVPLVLALLDRTSCGKLRGGGDGKVVPKFDEHFAGEYGHLLKVCAFVLAHNFRGPTYGVH